MVHFFSHSYSAMGPFTNYDDYLVFNKEVDGVSHMSTLLHRLMYWTVIEGGDLKNPVNVVFERSLRKESMEPLTMFVDFDQQ